MIKKLKFRFIAITMLAVCIVLSIIIITINVFSHAKMTTNADELLKIIEDVDGKIENYFDRNPGPDVPPNSEQKNDLYELFDPDIINPETPYETRYFTVKYSHRPSADLSHIASLSESEAIALADKAILSGRTRGYEGSYRFLVNKERNTVFFLDCTRQLQDSGTFFMVSFLCSIVGTIGVFLLVYALSARVVSPIAESYERQKRFITDAGHELKTPLTIISASNELIELTDGESENTRAISRQVSRMSSMVKNLSALASIDEMSKLANKANFSFSSTCSEVCDLFAPVFIKSKKNFNFDIAENIDYLGDESLIRQLLYLLLENSEKYSLTQTCVSLSKVGMKILLVVSNDASNIKNGDLSRCFERFYRSDETRASGIEGSGIGLCVAKEIVDLHGGGISAYGQDGIFTIKASFLKVF